MSEIELNRELRGLKADKKMTQYAIQTTQREMSSMLKNGMGDRMKAVLNGEAKVTCPVKEKFKFKLLYWLKKWIFSI